MRVLGISLAHDSGVCLYEDSHISLFLKEERFTRKKRDNLPFVSLGKLLEIDGNQVDAVVFSPVIDEEGDWITALRLIMQKHGQDLSKITFYNLASEHHLQHASFAFYSSGFDSATVIVVDRNGSNWFQGLRESETIFEASYAKGINPLYKNFWVYHNYGQYQAQLLSQDSGIEMEARSMFGIVKAYEAATTMIGQGTMENGKTMGLSAYGNKDAEYPSLFVDNTHIVNDFYFSHVLVPNDDYQTTYHFSKDPLGQNFSEDNYQEYADLAWQVQKQTQEALKILVQKALDKSDNKNIVLTGGYALNIVANQFLIKEFPDVNFYFEPIADDTGNSIGGAMWAYYQANPDQRHKASNGLFFHGYQHSLDEISGNHAVEKDVANLIMSDKSVAVYNGLSEAGPRALGNRSILFNAMNPDAKNLINKVKKREWYRPFALAVLEEDAHLYFDMIGQQSSRYMTISFDSLEETKKLFPGVVHVDGSCRIQTVGQNDGILFEILNEIKKISGHGVVLNTSFNLAGEPLVETPRDALRVLQNSTLDAVWFAEKKEIVFNS